MTAGRAVLVAVLIVLAWDAPAEPVASYRVYRAPAAGGPWALLKTVTTLGTRVELPVPGASCYRVRAVDELGQASPDSSRLCLTITEEVLP